MGTSLRPTCSRGPRLASPNQLRHSTDQKFKSVDHFKSCPVGSTIKFCVADSWPPQNEPQLTCAPSPEACHRHTDNNAGKSTADLPHEASMMSKRVPLEGGAEHNLRKLKLFTLSEAQTEDGHAMMEADTFHSSQHLSQRVLATEQARNAGDSSEEGIHIRLLCS